MEDYFLQYNISNVAKQFNIQSSHFKRGLDETLFDDTLFSEKEFLENGYIVRSFPEEWKAKIKTNITSFVYRQLCKFGEPDSNKSFALKDYHKYVTPIQHQKVVNSFRGGIFGTGGIPLDVLGVSHQELDEFVCSTISANRSISCKIKRFGLIPYGKFWIRIVRPNSNDNNPPHKDSHLKRLRKCVNIYLPLDGSNSNSSLPLVPKSHNEKETNYIISSSPCYVNSKKNTVPCIVHRDKGLDMICPNPSNEEIMIFTPHLIHGGGVNSNQDTTRVSLEMRFFEK